MVVHPGLLMQAVVLLEALVQPRHAVPSAMAQVLLHHLHVLFCNMTALCLLGWLQGMLRLG
jgi:hypothetical protein